MYKNLCRFFILISLLNFTMFLNSLKCQVNYKFDKIEYPEYYIDAFSYDYLESFNIKANRIKYIETENHILSGNDENYTKDIYKHFYDTNGITTRLESSDLILEQPVLNIYKFDSTGRLAEMKEKFPNFTGTYKYYYNSDGNCNRTEFYKADTLSKINFYSYDSKNRITEKREVKVKNGRDTSMTDEFRFIFANERLVKISRLNSMDEYKFLYNKLNNSITQLKMASRPDEWEKENIRYLDDYGNVIQTDFYSGIKQRLYERDYYTYNDSGNIISNHVVFIKGSVINSERYYEFEYNNKNLITTERIYDRSGKLLTFVKYYYEFYN